jgi:hypothetical protein
VRSRVCYLLLDVLSFLVHSFSFSFHCCKKGTILSILITFRVYYPPQCDVILWKTANTLMCSLESRSTQAVQGAFYLIWETQLHCRLCSSLALDCVLKPFEFSSQFPHFVHLNTCLIYLSFRYFFFHVASQIFKRNCFLFFYFSCEYLILVRPVPVFFLSTWLIFCNEYKFWNPPLRNFL